MKGWLFSGFVLLLWLGACGGAAAASSNESQLRRAKSLYDQKKYQEAIDQLDQVLTQTPDSVVANFNAAAAHYRQANYDKSRHHYSRALVSPEKSLEAKASYNMGNSLVKNAQIKENAGDLSAAEKMLKESLFYYQRAIDISPSDQDAKFNHEIATRELKILQEKIEQQPQCQTPKSSPKDQQGKKNNQNKQQEQPHQQSQQPQSGSSQQQQDPSQQSNPQDQSEQNSSDKDSEDQNQQKNDPASDSTDQQKESSDQGEQEVFGEESDRQMSEEEARMLLNTYSLEGPRLQMDDERQRSGEAYVEKKW